MAEVCDGTAGEGQADLFAGLDAWDQVGGDLAQFPESYTLHGQMVALVLPRPWDSPDQTALAGFEWWLLNILYCRTVREGGLAARRTRSARPMPHTAGGGCGHAGGAFVWLGYRLPGLFRRTSWRRTARSRPSDFS